ncbi:DUF6294 family protein [Actinoplanes sp. NPDC051343]|jgi:hypothetical protein|uniref:DUF6294 family protein n=1 Tax=Actinoplanes sp. NPDC051343 TaxID=3363906 RepID=UPI00379C3782
MNVPKLLGGATAGIAAGLLAIAVSAAPALADSNSGAAKQARVAPALSQVWTWGTLRSGDCQETNGRLTLNSDGTGDFSADTLTFQTHTHDVWHATFNLSTAGGTHLASIGSLDSPGMSDGNPPPVYHWDRTFKFDPGLFGAIGAVSQSHSC